MTLQCSLGRFPVSVAEHETIHIVKQNIRKTVPQMSHVNLKAFRINVNGQYLSDESKTVQALSINNGDVLHLVKKTVCPKAALDTEKKTDEE